MYLLIFNTFKFSNEVCLYIKFQKHKMQCDFCRWNILWNLIIKEWYQFLQNIKWKHWREQVGSCGSFITHYNGFRLQRVRLQWAPGYYEQIMYCTASAPNYNVQFSYKEHGATISTFLCIKLFVVSGPQCMWTGLILLTSDARAVLINWVPSTGAR